MDRVAKNRGMFGITGDWSIVALNLMFWDHGVLHSMRRGLQVYGLVGKERGERGRKSAEDRRKRVEVHLGSLLLFPPH